MARARGELLLGMRSLSLLPVTGTAAVLCWLGGCVATVPSAGLEREVELPVPRSVESAPTAERLTEEGNGKRYVLTARSVIPIAFNLQPDIKSSFQRFKSEEARYDFFYASRDSMTPKLSLANDVSEAREPNEETGRDATRSHGQRVELGFEKRFFDTSELDAGVGFRAETEEHVTGDQPFAFASLRYPLWASRERLGRTSEEIFRRNELNDTQLAYIQTVRNRLQNAVTKYYDVVRLGRQVERMTEWVADLRALAIRLDGGSGKDAGADRERLAAEITRVNSLLRNQTGWYEVQLAWLKQNIGLPFHAHVELRDEPFNPFEDTTHAGLLERVIETDPEIATLRNAMSNAEVQYELARKGRWDIALSANGSSDLEGGGADAGESYWSLSVGLDVSAVDPRVTDSLMRQASANMSRFKEAIAARENAIFASTLEPLVRLDTLGQSREDTIANLSRYEQDYAMGVEEYFAGTLNMDDLLSRRNALYTQQDEVAYLTFMLGANTSELCAATGLFFELLEEEPPAVQ